VADQDDGDPLRLGQSDHFAGAGPDLGDGAGPALMDVGPQGLDRIDDDDVELLALQRTQDVAQGRRRRQIDLRLVQPHPLGPRPDLLDGLFAGDIGDASAAKRRLGRDLEQQGGLAHARIAAQQDGRTRNHAAAADPVELGHARRDAGRFGGVGLKGFKLQAASARRSGRRRLDRARRRGTALFGQGVPLPAR